MSRQFETKLGLWRVPAIGIFAFVAVRRIVVGPYDLSNWIADRAQQQRSYYRSEDAVQFYARNDHMSLTIPYEYMGIDHAYEPDFLVRLQNGSTVLLEIKGFEDDQTKAKHTAAKR